MTEWPQRHGPNGPEDVDAAELAMAIRKHYAAARDGRLDVLSPLDGADLILLTKWAAEKKCIVDAVEKPSEADIERLCDVLKSEFGYAYVHNVKAVLRALRELADD